VEGLEDLPPTCIPELRFPRYSLHKRRLAARLYPLRWCWLAWVAVVFSLQGARELSCTEPCTLQHWLVTLQRCVEAFLALSSLFTLLCCSARDAWGGQSPVEDELLWPSGQPGEVAGQVLAPCEVGVRALPAATRPLRIVIFTIGTRGDVQPYLALGAHLKDTCGHAVTIASSEDHEELVRGSGLTFFSTGIPRVEQPSHWLAATSVADMIVRTGPKLTEDYATVAGAFLRAAKQGGAGGGADVLIGTNMTLTFALNIGESLGLPVWTAKLAPDLPTPAFSLPGFSPSALGFVNYLSGLWYWVSVALAVSSTGVSQKEDDFRTQQLGLHKVVTAERLESFHYTPSLLGFSSALFPAPTTYPAHAFQCGFWLNADSGGGLYDPHLGQVAPALRAFVEHKAEGLAGIVCITFGSMENGPVGVLERLVESCTKKRNLRVVILSGGMAGNTRLEAAFAHVPKDRLFIAPSVPHSYLFPRCELVVHHGGAGTTARALASAVPSLIIPVLRWSDQMLWGALVEQQGVGILLRDKDPSPRAINTALNALLTMRKDEFGRPEKNGFMKKASTIGARLRGERSCTIVNSLLTSCLCRLLLPSDAAERARLCNAGEGGSLQERDAAAATLPPLERMCARHCVPCNSHRRGIAGGRPLPHPSPKASPSRQASRSPSRARQRPSSPSASAPPVLTGSASRRGGAGRKH
jgi:sterol 3beta-glucosyltransferase